MFIMYAVYHAGVAFLGAQNRVGTMHRMSMILAVVALGQSVCAFAAPVTDADLRGKKICWNTGFTSSYNKDGSFDGNRSGHGTWRLNGDLLTVSAEHGSERAILAKKEALFTALGERLGVVRT
jgi:hypothetical protein